MKLLNKNNETQFFLHKQKTTENINEKIFTTEEVIKAKKNQTPKSDRKTNVTWSQNWLNIIKDNSRLVDVINVGNIRPLEEGKHLYCSNSLNLLNILSCI